MQAPELANGADRAIRRRDNPRGIACLVAGIAIFSLQDLILKLLSGDYPLHQAMVLRSVTALPILLGFVAIGGGLRRLLTPGWPVLLLRGLILFAAYTSYYLGLAALPMATTVTLSFVAPLFITLLSVVVLGERVGPRRWLAVAAGFGGVTLMVRPGSALFDWAALLPVFCGLAYGLSMITARSLGIRQSAAVMAFWGNLALMLACGVIAAAGLTLLTEAYRIAEANVVAPFEYTAILWGVAYGWAFWRDWPDPTAWLGIAVVVGAGLYVLSRERAAGRSP